MTDFETDERTGPSGTTGRGHRTEVKSAPDAEARADEERRAASRAEARRFTRGRTRRRGVLIAVAASFVALVGFVVVAIVSPIMSVRSIEVEGLERLDEVSVHEALADLQGQPLAMVTSGDVASRLEPFVLVQSYSTRAEPPSTLVVQIVERQAIGALPNGAGHTVYDAAGVALWDAPAPPADVPALDLGGADTASPAFTAAAEVSLALPATFRAQVATIVASSQDNVTLELRDGTSVVWGSAEHSPRKVEVLLALIAATAGESPSQYDVSSPEAPVTR